MRVSQITIIAGDLPRSISFYQEAFGAIYDEEAGAFQFGSYPGDDFFLLTVANRFTHPWPGGPVKFGLLVEDVDATHAHALTAGAVEINPPQKRSWTPRCSTIRDPGGNHIDLFAAPVSESAIDVMADARSRQSPARAATW